MSSPNSQTSTAAKQDTWSADQYNAVASFVYSKEFTTPVFSLLNAQPGERILDLGCGSGELTIELAKIVGERGVVIGVDASVSMVGSLILRLHIALYSILLYRSRKQDRTEPKLLMSPMHRHSNFLHLRPK